MRPLRLTMQAFGSYGALTTIDFEKATQNIFLIAGNTGSGKTTIFDAIVFALYGEASSGDNKKDGMELQSQFIDVGTTPFVELTFREGSEEYTVRRTPRHQRPFKNKEGVTDQPSSVSLTMPDGLEYQPKETNRKLEDIVGLSKDQFMQVAMIAQGEFMDVLRESSDNKKKIFRKLFNTEIFNQIVDEVANRGKEKRNEIDQIQAICRAEVARIEFPGEYPKAVEIRSAITAVQNAKRFAITDVECVQEELSQLTTYLKGELESATKANDQAAKERDECRAQLAAAESLLKLFNQLDQSMKTLDLLAVQKETIESKNKEIQHIQDAYRIQPIWQMADAAKKGEAACREALEKEIALLPELQEREKRAEAALQEARANRDQLLKDYTRVSEKTEKAEKLFEELEKAESELQTADDRREDAEQKEATAKKALEELNNQEKNWREEEQALRDTDRLLTELRAKNDEVLAAESDRKAVADQQTTVEQQKQRVDSAKSAYIDASTLYNEENARCQEYRNAYLGAQAGLLASELIEGERCPVCGSTEHPAPRVLDEEEKNLSQERMNDLEKVAADARKAQEDAAATAKSSAEVLNTQEKALADAYFKLAEKMRKLFPEQQSEGASLDSMRSLIGEWANHFKEREKELLQNQKTLQTLRKQLETVDDTRTLHQNQMDEELRKANDARLEVEGIQTRIRTLNESKEYDSREDAQQAHREAKIRKDDSERQFISAEQALSGIREQKNQTQTRLEEHKAELPMLESDSSEKHRRYNEELQRIQIDEEGWMDICRNHPAEDADTYRKEVQIYREKVTAAESLKKAAIEAIGTQERPELTRLQAGWKDADQKWKATQGSLQRLREMNRTNESVRDAIDAKRNDRQVIIEEYNKLTTLYSLLAGKVSGQRMDIETYVQRYYLDQILQAANRRFEDMSGGQFELRMVDLDKAGTGKNHGLDLMVYSHVTGSSREIRTLSGGESFMAALSLALGMADQIQASSAAVHLDMMFIDEGFGSLDENSRNQAVRVLKNMAGGSRLIGIISHVTELKQELENQLVVTKDEHGSHVRWSD